MQKLQYFELDFHILRILLVPWGIGVKQDSLPCVESNEGHRILLESSWKLVVAPTRNEGLFSTHIF